MHESTFPFWVIVIGTSVILSVVLGFTDPYILNSELPSLVSIEKKEKNELIEIKAKERFDDYVFFFIIITPTIIATVLFLWQYFSFHPFTSELPSILNSIGVILATILICPLFLAAQVLIFAIAKLIHTYIFERKYAKIYDRKVIITFQK